jgi:hypothetical protein
MIEKASGSRTEVHSIVPIVSSFEYIAALDKRQIESVSGSCVEVAKPSPSNNRASFASLTHPIHIYLYSVQSWTNHETAMEETKVSSARGNEEDGIDGS